MKALRPSQITHLHSQLEKAIMGVTPALQASVFVGGEKVFSDRLGAAATYFDLASLTKIIFTTSRLMQLIDEDRFDLDQKVGFYLPWFHHSSIEVRDLLTHAAGFRWWAPFYKELDMSLSFAQRWMQLQLLLRDEAPLHPVTEARYSDIDFLFLGLILEHIENKPLFEIWQSCAPSFGGERLHFCRDNKPFYPRRLYAATENCPWRGEVMQGQVHDENAWALGGVAPHAGLFGRLEDVENWALALRASYLGLKTGFVSQAVVKQFVRRQVNAQLGHWGYGFMMPTPGSSSSGGLFSPNSFGHTGFTGTSFWWDLDRDVMILLLANRVHPTRENKLFVQLRPQIHNWIMQQLNLG